jgi:phage tail-like protein
VTPRYPYRYAPLEGEYTAVAATSGVCMEDGALRLAPVLTRPEALGDVPIDALAGPAGMAVGPDGTLYLADPGGGRIVRVDCAGCASTFGCLGEPGAIPGDAPFVPRGISYGPRDSLYIADAGGGRVVVVDRTTAAVRSVWLGFTEPWDVAVDSSGCIYVADHGAAAVVRCDGEGGSRQRFDGVGPDGPGLRGPRSVAVFAPAGGDERIAVIDDGAGAASPSRIVVLGLDGSVDADATDRLASRLRSRLDSVAAGPGVLYVAGPGGVLAFDDQGFVGRVQDAGTAVGLAVDCAGRLLISDTGGAAALSTPGRMSTGTALVRAPGADLAGPWDEVRVEAGPLPSGGRYQLFTLTSQAPATPAPPAAAAVASGDVDEPGAPMPTPLDRWRAAPANAPSARVLCEQGRWLWVAIALEGDGTTTPEIRSIRFEVTGRGLRAQLPAVYSRDAAADDELGRFLALVASVFEESDDAYDDLPNLLDADGADDEWLALLADWLAADLLPGDEPTRRDAVREATRRHAIRGTLGAMSSEVERLSGVAVTITEPASNVVLWSLGSAATSSLGSSTALVPASADIAALDTTAVLDGSMIAGPAGAGFGPGGYGTALFDAVAHRFCVHVHADAVRTADARARLEAAIAAAKPVHTVHEVSVIEAETRIGQQASVGINLIVGRGPAELRLGEGGSALAGSSRPEPIVGGRIGATTRVGWALEDVRVTCCESEEQP